MIFYWVKGNWYFDILPFGGFALQRYAKAGMKSFKIVFILEISYFNGTFETVIE
jgi:hypothetical protein